MLMRGVWDPMRHVDGDSGRALSSSLLDERFCSYWVCVVGEWFAAGSQLMHL